MNSSTNFCANNTNPTTTKKTQDVLGLIAQFNAIGFHWFINSMNQLVYEANEDRWDDYTALSKFENAKELRAALTELGRVEPPMPKFDPSKVTYKRIEY